MKQSRIEKIKFSSKALNKEMAMWVYLPSCYDSNQEPLPVLYFLHGRSGNEEIMLQLDLRAKADRMIEEEKIQPMIIVCPRLDNSRGLNSSDICREVKELEGSDRMIHLGRYEDYFMDEVIPLVDSRFCTINDRSGRYIGGISVGGYIALHSTLRHDQMFSKVGGHMPALELVLEEDAKPYFKDMDMWRVYDPIHIAKEKNITKDLKVYLDAGNQDEGEFYKGCRILEQILREKNIWVENHIFSGHHNLEYIQSNLEGYLKFYGNLLSKK